jgi:hypothetical protein
MSKDYRSQVFHLCDSHQLCNAVEEFGCDAVFPDDYILVAIVDSEVLEKVFELTNHIDSPWWDNDGVEVVGDNHHRSTSVGDIVVTNEGTFRCENMGWHELETVVR